MSQQFVEQGHLGGYVEGGDEATNFPALWEGLVNDLEIKSVLDIGCGEGHSLRYFRELGCRVLGVEGVPQQDWDIMVHDFTEGPLTLAREWDLAWCCEFVEHVEEKYMPNFLKLFEQCRYVAMTHAGPGQGGYHHVNCQLPAYWLGAMAAIGFEYDAVLTLWARSLAGANENPWNHFVRSGLVFKRL